MDGKFEAVADAVEHTSRFLHAYGDRFHVPGLEALRDRLRAGDKTAIVAAISEATGGMGSLKDRYLHPNNGDSIEPYQVEVANEQLTCLVRAVEAHARAAAAKHNIRLIR